MEKIENYDNGTNQHTNVIRNKEASAIKRNNNAPVAQTIIALVTAGTTAKKSKGSVKLEISTHGNH